MHITFLQRLGRDRPKIASKQGWFAFQIALFFLPSSALLAGLGLLPAAILGSQNRPKGFFRDTWNTPFIVISLLMLLGAFNSYTGFLAIVGLGNWLPFFWLFWALQPYLVTGRSRLRAALCLLTGTLPVFVTGFGQIWFGWEGPWQILGGSIIWFVSPSGSPVGRLSGLFDYANIAGAWLALTWPFALAALLRPGLNSLKRIGSFLFAAFIVFASVLTHSRNAWGGLILAIPFVLGPTRWIWLLPLLAFLLLPIGLSVLPGVNSDVQLWARQFVPESIWARLNDMRYGNARNFAATRIGQWSIALKIIFERPLLGWGAAAFSVLYPLRTGLWHGHAHNLPLELAVSHGIPVSIIFVSTVLLLLITAVRRDVLVKGVSSSFETSTRIFDRAWWTSTFILIAIHCTDMPFFDSRINIAGWILLAGLRCIIISDKENYVFSSLRVDDAR